MKDATAELEQVVLSTLAFDLEVQLPYKWIFAALKALKIGSLLIINYLIIIFIIVIINIIIIIYMH